MLSSWPGANFIKLPKHTNLLSREYCGLANKGYQPKCHMLYVDQDGPLQKFAMQCFLLSSFKRLGPGDQSKEKGFSATYKLHFESGIKFVTVTKAWVWQSKRNLICNWKFLQCLIELNFYKKNMIWNKRSYHAWSRRFAFRQIRARCVRLLCRHLAG